MDLTKEQAILERRKMWNWIADEIEDSKCVKWIGELKENTVKKINLICYVIVFVVNIQECIVCVVL